jgi:ATP-dependent DNA ligase
MTSTSIVVRDYSKEIPGGLSDQYTWSFPEIIGKNSHSRTTYWVIRVSLRAVADPDTPVEILPEYFDNKPMQNMIAVIKVDSGVVGGKLRKSEPTIVTTGKNLGRASATNVFCQALRDAYGLHNKQARKAKVDPELYPPMLAQVYKDQREKPVPTPGAPLYIQRKYNGIRAVARANQGVVEIYSRRLQPYNIEALKKILGPILAAASAEAAKRLLPTNVYLDGELYAHGVNLQTLSGHARKGNDLPYMVYDLFIPGTDLVYSERLAILAAIFAAIQSSIPMLKSPGGESTPVVSLAPTYTCTATEEIQVYYEQFISEGYEGAMVRTNDKYQHAYNEYHSAKLLKIKPTYDEEFEVVDWTVGDRGKAAAALMIVCKTPAGDTFPVTPAMTLEERNGLAAKMPNADKQGKTYFERHWKGKKITVYFDEYSAAKIPQRARTKLETRSD